uniref:Uncharacterized protein n=1 Tax=Arundo donax TaxID=35708 RepID=A0A0A9G447_ARUDO
MDARPRANLTIGACPENGCRAVHATEPSSHWNGGDGIDAASEFLSRLNRLSRTVCALTARGQRFNRLKRIEEVTEEVVAGYPSCKKWTWT